MKKPDGKKMIEDSKKEVNKTKGNTEMKKTAFTVFITLATVAAFAGIFYLGTQFGAQQEKAVNTRIVTEAQSLAKTVEPSKQ